MQKENQTMWEKSWSVVIGTVIVVSMAALDSCAGPQQSVAESPQQTMDAPQGAKVLFQTEAGTTVAPKMDNQASTSSKPRKPRVETALAPGKPKGPQEFWLGLSYWVEWERSGMAPTRIADPSAFVFQSGDRVRFHVTTNMEGHLYVVNWGSSGRGTVLFPHAGMVEQHPRVEARKEYIVPSQGWIRFDNQPGEEGIQFILSQVPVTDILGTTQPPADSGRLIAALDRRGAKDLLVERDEAEGQKATYVGAMIPPAAGDAQMGPLVIYRTRLFHQ